MGLGLFMRIRRKLRLLRRSKAEAPSPILTWESFDEAAMRDLIEDIGRQAEEDAADLEQNLHNPN